MSPRSWLLLFAVAIVTSPSIITLKATSENSTQKQRLDNENNFTETATFFITITAPQEIPLMTTDQIDTSNMTTNQNDSEDNLSGGLASWMATVIEYRWQDKYNVIFWIGIIPTLAAIASIGNVLVLVVASISPQFRTVSCIFLTNLSAIDAFQTVIIVPFRVLETFVIKFPFKEYWICKFIYVMRESLYICYMETFILIAIERYIVVVYPMKAMHICTKKRARWAICAIWLFSLVLASPTWFQMSLVGVKDDWPICTREIIRRNYPGVDVDLWRNLHESYSLFILYVVPLTALLICYSVVAVALYRSIKASQQLTQRCTVLNRATVGGLTLTPMTSVSSQEQHRRSVPDLQRERILVLRMCVVLVTFFGICQGPWRIHYWINVLMPEAIPPEINSKLQAPFFALCLLNSSVNPIIYGFMSRNFRQAFVLVIARWCMIPMRLYNRSILRWQLDKEDRRKRQELEQLRKNSSLSAGKASEMDSKSSNSSRRASSTCKLVNHYPSHNKRMERYRCNSLSASEADSDLNNVNRGYRGSVAVVVLCEESSQTGTSAEIVPYEQGEAGTHPAVIYESTPSPND